MRLARPGPRRRLRRQTQVGEDLLNREPLEDGGGDLELLEAAVRAVPQRQRRSWIHRKTPDQAAPEPAIGE
jgi:hypothetical protein